jgi:hypothetical protein
MLREDVTLIDAQVPHPDVPPPADPATRCGVAKPLAEQSDEDLVAKFRAADLARRQGVNAALAGAFLCADVVAAFRERSERLTFPQIARILGVELRTAEQYHTLYTRYPDRDKRPTEGSQRDLNLAFREVKKLMPGASKEKIAQVAAEKAKEKRLERPAKKPRGRAAAKKSPLPARTKRAERTPSALPSVVETIAPPAAPVDETPSQPAPSMDGCATTVLPKSLTDFKREPWHIEQAISRALVSMQTAREVLDVLIAVREGIQSGLEELSIPLSMDERKAVSEELREISTLLSRTVVASGALT